jgi:hypothetical protein
MGLAFRRAHIDRHSAAAGSISKPLLRLVLQVRAIPPSFPCRSRNEKSDTVRKHFLVLRCLVAVALRLVANEGMFPMRVNSRSNFKTAGRRIC